MQAVSKKSRWPLPNKLVGTHGKSEICRVLNCTSSFTFLRSGKLRKGSLQWFYIKLIFFNYIIDIFFLQLWYLLYWGSLEEQLIAFKLKHTTKVFFDINQS